MKSKTNWKKLKEMTDRDIENGAKSDPDAQLLTETELKQFKRLDPPKSIDVAAVRHKLHMSQNEFSKAFGFNKRTLEQWEQHRRQPTGPAKMLLLLIWKQPKMVRDLLIKVPKKKP